MNKAVRRSLLETLNYDLLNTSQQSTLHQPYGNAAQLERVQDLSPSTIAAGQSLPWELEPMFVLGEESGAEGELVVVSEMGGGGLPAGGEPPTSPPEPPPNSPIDGGLVDQFISKITLPIGYQEEGLAMERPMLAGYLHQMVEQAQSISQETMNAAQDAASEGGTTDSGQGTEAAGNDGGSQGGATDGGQSAETGSVQDTVGDAVQNIQDALDQMNDQIIDEIDQILSALDQARFVSAVTEQFPIDEEVATLLYGHLVDNGMIPNDEIDRIRYIGDEDFVGTDDMDIIIGGAGANVIDGMGGNDFIYAGGGNDDIHAGDGEDLIFGGEGNDTILGGRGEDGIFGGSGSDYLIGGDDTGSQSSDFIIGAEGDDIIVGGALADQLYGGDGNDLIHGHGGDDGIYAGHGDDEVYGGDGNDIIEDWTGNDYIEGGSGNDTIDGDIGDDTIYGGSGVDTIEGGSGNDTIFGGEDGDTIDGGSGNDTIFGEAGEDTIDGSFGNDLILGGVGADTINGGSGDDVISGGEDTDTISIDHFGSDEVIADPDDVPGISPAEFADQLSALIPITPWDNDLNPGNTLYKVVDGVATFDDSAIARVENSQASIRLRLHAKFNLLSEISQLSSLDPTSAAFGQLNNSLDAVIREFSIIQESFSASLSALEGYSGSEVVGLDNLRSRIALVEQHIENMNSAKGLMVSQGLVGLTSGESNLNPNVGLCDTEEVPLVENIFDSGGSGQGLLRGHIQDKLLAADEYHYNFLSLISGGGQYHVELVTMLPGGSEKADQFGLLGFEGCRLVDQQLDRLDLSTESISTGFDAGWGTISSFDYLNYNLAYYLPFSYNLVAEVLLAQKFTSFFAEVKHLFEKAKKAVEDIALNIFDNFLDLIGDRGQEVLHWLGQNGEVFSEIYHNPREFMANLGTAIRDGFTSFGNHFEEHLEDGFFTWLFGQINSGGIQVPETWNLEGIFNLVTQVLGVNYQSLRQNLVEAIDNTGEDGEQAVEWGEGAFDLLIALKNEGPGAMWERLQDDIKIIEEELMTQLVGWVEQELVIEGVEKLLEAFVPGAGLFEAIKEIYEFVTWFIDEFDRIVNLVQTILSSLGKIAQGDTETASSYIEAALANEIPVIMDLMSHMLNIDISGTLRTALNSIQQTIHDGIASALDWVATKLQELFGIVPEDERPGATDDELLDSGKLSQTIHFRAGGDEHALRFDYDDGGTVLVGSRGGSGRALAANVLGNEFEDYDFTSVKAYLKNLGTQLDAKQLKETVGGTSLLGAAGDACTDACKAAQTALQAKKKAEADDTQGNKDEFVNARNNATANLNVLKKALLPLEEIKEIWRLNKADGDIPSTVLNHQMVDTEYFRGQTLPDCPTNHNTSNVQPNHGNRKAKTVIAEPFTKNGDAGSQPSENPAGWAEHILTIKRAGKNYKRLHILNDNTHGPGVNWNLTPGTASDNSSMETDIERGMKDLVNKKNAVLWFEGEVEYRSDEGYQDFAKGIRIQYGHLNKDGTRGRKIVNKVAHVSKPAPRCTTSRKPTLNTISRSKFSSQAAKAKRKQLPGLENLTADEMAKEFVRIRRESPDSRFLSIENCRDIIDTVGGAAVGPAVKVVVNWMWDNTDKNGIQQIF